MNSTIKSIISDLNSVFAPMDQKVLDDTHNWAIGRMQALKEYKISEEFKSIRKDFTLRARKLESIAGGKAWLNLFETSNSAGVAVYVEKNHIAIIEKRNNTIANKLVKAGVTTVLSSEFNHTKDGFNGEFVVDTDAGQKTVTVQTVYAGGHNIQCLHLRVLTKIK